MRRVLAAAFAASWLCAAAAHADCIVPPAFTADAATTPDATGAAGAVGQTRRDNAGRVVAPVFVNGRGPYRFIVDTGANRSAISNTLAAELGLVPGGVGDVHTVEGVTQAPLVAVDSLRYQALSMPSSAVPILTNSRVLAGESGLLGVDGMQGRRLKIDFRRRCIEIIPAHTAPRLSARDWITVHGELRFGHLVVIPARIRNVDINVLIDTGSDTSMANLALRDALSGMQLRDADIERAFTAGRPVFFERAIIIPQLEIDDVEITRVTALIGDLHIFNLWGFANEPTLLIGMDVIRETQGIAIDYQRATVHFRVPRPLTVTVR